MVLAFPIPETGMFYNRNGKLRLSLNCELGNSSVR